MFGNTILEITIIGTAIILMGILFIIPALGVLVLGIGEIIFEKKYLTPSALFVYFIVLVCIGFLFRYLGI